MEGDRSLSVYPDPFVRTVYYHHRSIALKPFLRMLRVYPAIHGITLPGPSVTVKYSAYTDNVTGLVTNNVEISVGAEIRLYEIVAGAKINCDKSCGLRIGA